MQLWYLLTLVELSHTLHSAGPPGSSITTVPVWQFSLVYASLFSHLCVFPSHPLSGSMRSSFTAPLWPEPYRCQSPWRWADRHPTPLLRPTERVGKKKKKNERKEGLCVSVIPFYSSWENANSIDFELKRWCFFFLFFVNEKTLLGANGPWKE